MFLSLFLQASAANNPMQLIMLLGFVLVFYFFFIRPQQKRTSEARKLRENLTKGARVVTIGGLHGRIAELSEEKVVLEVDKGLRLTFDRTAIAKQLDVPKAAGETAA